jgi:hypothetical protein
MFFMTFENACSTDELEPPIAPKASSNLCNASEGRRALIEDRLRVFWMAAFHASKVEQPVCTMCCLAMGLWDTTSEKS